MWTLLHKCQCIVGDKFPKVEFLDQMAHVFTRLLRYCHVTLPLACTMSHSPTPRLLVSLHHHSWGTFRWLRQAGRMPREGRRLTPGLALDFVHSMTGRQLWWAHHVHPHRHHPVERAFLFPSWDGKNHWCHHRQVFEMAAIMGGEAPGPKMEKALCSFLEWEDPRKIKERK